MVRHDFATHREDQSEKKVAAGQSTQRAPYPGSSCPGIGRPELDTLLEAARKDGLTSDAMDATYAVADALRARTHADNILKQIVYPKMKTEKKGGAGIETLLVVEGLLRGAQEPDDVKGALGIAIEHFKDKPDHGVPKRGHKEFAQQLERRLMH